MMQRDESDDGRRNYPEGDSLVRDERGSTHDQLLSPNHTLRSLAQGRAESTDGEPKHTAPDPSADTIASLPGLVRSDPDHTLRSQTGEISVGDRLGDYHLTRKLGAGGMGDVFEAHHVQTGERVALKTLVSTTATRLYRFKREFRALADISHENLVRLHALTVPRSGCPFFTMELIDGLPFVEWVRNGTPEGEPPDLARLKDGMRQLVEGVDHLHRHDFIHRDIKPANVLVGGDGRVVVLDFGLVFELSSIDAGVTRDRQILGTPSFMAPEQATGDRVGAPADFYAIGVMLFQSLTGQLPHQGPALQQMVAKQGSTPDPGSRVGGIPSALRTLCMRLLSRDPDARPGGTELLKFLQGPSSAASSTAWGGAPKPRPAPSRGPLFVGRRQELATLHAALGDVREHDRPVVLHLRGRSGDGKSALVRRFRSEIQHTGAVVLHGRCRERETVPYKGIDAVIDALSAHLRNLPEAERDELRPPDLDALVRLFPVLDEIWSPGQPLALGLAEVRNLGTATLRKLLEHMSRRCALVLHVDDFQWADLDSVSLLQALIRPPTPPALMLVVCYRNDVEESEALRALRASEGLAGPQTRTIELGPLSAADARELAHALLKASHSDPPQRSRAETIAMRSRGNPFFIAQMALGGSELDTAESNLDQIMVRRLSDLAGDQRRLLELVAVFGGPLPTTIARQMCSKEADTSLDSLCQMGLLVRDEGQGDRVEAAHDRVREVVLEELSDDERTALHQQLGEHLLKLHGGDPPGDDIFAVVNQLDAGLTDLGALSEEHRLELTTLNHRAGQRALESTAWVAARRYFGFAHRLIQPWLPDARKGQGHHDLCVAVAFGRAQIEVHLETEEGDAAITELLGWSLSKDDYCRIAQWYCWNLSLAARLADCVHFGLDALAHVGFPAPRRPTWVGAVFSYLRGWRALRKMGVGKVPALPPIEDPPTRAAMDILAAAAAYSTMVDIKLHLAIAGVHSRLLPKHGFHDGAGVALSALAISAAAQGKCDEARELCDVIHGFTEDPTLSPFAQYGPQGIILSALNTVFPMDEAMRRSDGIYERAFEVAPQTLVEAIGLNCCTNRYCASVPLPGLLEFVDTFESRHDGFKLSWVSLFVAACRHHARSLVQGQAEPLSATTMAVMKGSSSQIEDIVMGSITVMQLEVALLLGESERAWELTMSLSRDYERKVGTLWHAPSYAMMSTIVMADRWRTHASERGKLRRLMRKRRATARRWAQRCPENYQPMLDIIEAELAGLKDRYDEAVGAFERARARAGKQNVSRLVGMASERYAQLAQRRGQPLVADAAHDAARQAYETWGATAVIQRLDAQRGADSKSSVLPL